MRIIISPAKKMRVDTDSFACRELPVFLDRTETLMNWIRSLSYKEQKKLWACSDKIAQENAERFAEMDLRKNLTPAIIAYDRCCYHFDESQSTDTEYVFIRTEIPGRPRR